MNRSQWLKDAWNSILYGSVYRDDPERARKAITDYVSLVKKAVVNTAITGRERDYWRAALSVRVDQNDIDSLSQLLSQGGLESVREMRQRSALRYQMYETTGTMPSTWMRKIGAHTDGSQTSASSLERISQATVDAMKRYSTFALFSKGIRRIDDYYRSSTEITVLFSENSGVPGIKIPVRYTEDATLSWRQAKEISTAMDIQADSSNFYAMSMMLFFLRRAERPHAVAECHFIMLELDKINPVPDQEYARKVNAFFPQIIHDDKTNGQL